MLFTVFHRNDLKMYVPFLCLQLLETLKAKIMRNVPAVESVPSDMFSQMRNAQESFVMSHSRKVRGREDILGKVSKSRISHFIIIGVNNVHYVYNVTILWCLY